MEEPIKIVFKKICQNPKCKHGFDFESTSRNQKYCCDECADIMRGKKRAQSKKRAIKRKEYKENQEINKALNRAYGLAHCMAEEVYKIPKVCDITGKDPSCGEDFELHHKDLNPFNNAPWNLVWLSKSAHKMLHDRTADINMVVTYNEALESENPAEYLREKLKDVAEYETVKTEVRKKLGLDA